MTTIGPSTAVAAQSKTRSVTLSERPAWGRLVRSVLVTASFTSLCALGSPSGPTASDTDADAVSTHGPRLETRSPGIDYGQLEGLDGDIKSEHYQFIDSLLVVRCGVIGFNRRYVHDYAKVYGVQAHTETPLSPQHGGAYNYFDATWHPYIPYTDLHAIESVTKTVTSVMIGVAMQQGDFKAGLDTPILNYFKDRRVAGIDDRKRHVTLRHLLTMTSGLDWTPYNGYMDPRNASTQMESSKDWVQYAIDRPMEYEPGTKLVYSDGNAELLGYIFQKETGDDIAQYAQQHLFAPLGIGATYWKRTPTGVANTEGGLYLRSEDMAKIGLLYLDNGMWDGQQIVSADWVRQSLSPQVQAGKGQEIGLLWWLEPHGAGGDATFAGHGFGGQVLLVDRERNLVVVLTAWDIPQENAATQKEILERVVKATSKDTCSRP
jgi:CubicO group peptidase (beta-lactamase class C family)